LLNGSGEKLGAFGICLPFELGHLQHELFELGVFIGDAALVEGKLVRGGRARDAGSFRLCVILGRRGGAKAEASYNRGRHRERREEVRQPK
jgi:hypothetical protein